MFRDATHERAIELLRVKICGITNAVDAQAAAECGADAIGINLYRGSRRYVEMGGARNWLVDFPQTLSVVAVMVNPTWDEALEISELPFVNALQLHGQETPEFCRKLADRGVRFAKALPVIDAESLERSDRFSTRTVVLDSASGGAFGGTGKTFPWEVAADLVARNPSMRVVLAGGLTPENVGAAVAAVRPFAVDVTSGTESVAGVKDHGRLRAFLAAAHGI